MLPSDSILNKRQVCALRRKGLQKFLSFLRQLFESLYDYFKVWPIQLSVKQLLQIFETVLFFPQMLLFLVCFFNLLLLL